MAIDAWQQLKREKQLRQDSDAEYHQLLTDKDKRIEELDDAYKKQLENNKKLHAGNQTLSAARTKTQQDLNKAQQAIKRAEHGEKEAKNKQQSDRSELEGRRKEVPRLKKQIDDLEDLKKEHEAKLAEKDATLIGLHKQIDELEESRQEATEARRQTQEAASTLSSLGADLEEWFREELGPGLTFDACIKHASRAARSPPHQLPRHRPEMPRLTSIADEVKGTDLDSASESDTDEDAILTLEKAVEVDLDAPTVDELKQEVEAQTSIAQGLAEKVAKAADENAELFARIEQMKKTAAETHSANVQRTNEKAMRASMELAALQNKLYDAEDEAGAERKLACEFEEKLVVSQSKLANIEAALKDIKEARPPPNTFSEISAVEIVPVRSTPPSADLRGADFAKAPPLPPSNTRTFDATEMWLLLPFWAKLVLLMLVTCYIYCFASVMNERHLWLAANDLTREHLVDFYSDTSSHWLAPILMPMEDWIGVNRMLLA